MHIIVYELYMMLYNGIIFMKIEYLYFQLICPKFINFIFFKKLGNKIICNESNKLIKYVIFLFMHVYVLITKNLIYEILFRRKFN